MFCVKCGTQIPEDAAFCNKCGGKTNAPIEQCTEKTVPDSNKAQPNEDASKISLVDTLLYVLSILLPIALLFSVMENGLWHPFSFIGIVIIAVLAVMHIIKNKNTKKSNLANLMPGETALLTGRCNCELDGERVFGSCAITQTRFVFTEDDAASHFDFILADVTNVEMTKDSATNQDCKTLILKLNGKRKYVLNFETIIKDNWTTPENFRWLLAFQKAVNSHLNPQ